MGVGEFRRAKRCAKPFLLGNSKGQRPLRTHELRVPCVCFEDGAGMHRVRNTESLRERESCVWGRVFLCVYYTIERGVGRGEGAGVGEMGVAHVGSIERRKGGSCTKRAGPRAG